MTIPRWQMALLFLALVALACGVLVESQTLVNDDGSSSSSLFIVMDRSLYDLDPSIAASWDEQKVKITQLLQERGATVTPFSDTQYDGLEAKVTFPDLETLTAAQSGEDLSLFTSFILKRWRGEFVFEAHTNGQYIAQRISQITGISSTELYLLTDLNLGLGLKLPGTLINHDAHEIRADNMLLSGNINSDKKAGEVKVVHCADEEALHT
jgi:hypothetical protein